MKIKIPIYKIKIKIYFSNNIKKVINKIKKRYNKRRLYKISKIDFDGLVICQFIPKHKLIYVLIKKNNNGIDMDILTHEIYHLTNKIMKYNGFKFNKSDEPFARLNGKLNSMIIQQLIKQGQKFYYSDDKNIIIC